MTAASRNGKDCGSRKEVSKQLKNKGRETTAKTPKGKGNKSSSKDISKFHLKKCPSLYAPHGTNPCEYYPVIVRFFEDFKLQLRMAQNQCVTFVPWSCPLTTSKRDWKDKDDDKYTTNKSDPALPLTLTLPVNSIVKEQQKETKSKKETVEVDSLWQWDYHDFDSDDQRLFYDSDPKMSQTTDSPDQTPPPLPSKHTENLSPLNKDISIDISSSNSNVSSVIQPGRRKRKLLGRRIVGSSDATLTGDKQSSSRQSLTSLSRAPVHNPALSSSPNITDVEEGPEQLELHSKKG